MQECIRLESINKSIGERNILKSVCFHAQKGDIFGLLGPNGAGKTTTIRVILGLLKPTGGNLYLFGKRVNSDSRPHNSKIGFVLDKHGFYNNLSANENLYIYGKLYGLDRTTIKKRIDLLINLLGLQNRLNDTVKTYSKGMCQKLAIARSLLHQPDILILDEPTSGLDPTMQVEIRNLIEKLSKEQEMTILLSSHNLDEVERISNRIAIIASGQVKVFDEKNKLLAVKGLMVEFSFESEMNPAQAEKIIKNISFIKNAGNAIFELNKLKVCIDSKEVVPKIYQELIKENINVLKMDIKEPKLEDVYLSVVGGGVVAN